MNQFHYQIYKEMHFELIENMIYYYLLISILESMIDYVHLVNYNLQ
jgi:hypothetical protein